MRKPNHTQVANDFIDTHIRDLSGAAVKVCLVIFRQTVGWHKETDPVSVSQLTEKTGLSNRAVLDAVQELLTAGLITAEKSPGQTTVYGITYDTCEESSQVPPQKVHTQKKGLNKQEEGGASSAAAPGEASQPRPVSEAAAPPLPILEEIKKEAVARGKGTSWMSPGWTARFERLVREVREVDILPAFRACLDAGGNPHYFPADFAKWQGKVATSTTAVTARPASTEHPAAKCPMCGEPMMRADDGWACMPCHERFDRNLKHEVLVTVEEIHEATERLRMPAYMG